jgi:hypothetical protein
MLDGYLIPLKTSSTFRFEVLLIMVGTLPFGDAGGGDALDNAVGDSGCDDGKAFCCPSTNTKYWLLLLTKANNINTMSEINLKIFPSLIRIFIFLSLLNRFESLFNSRILVLIYSIYRGRQQHKIWKSGCACILSLFNATIPTLDLSSVFSLWFLGF